MKDRVFILDSEPEEQESIFCPFCKKVGLYIPLGKKILLPNEVKQPDYDNWMQCQRCREIIPLYQVEPEPSIGDSVTLVDNPFEDIKGHIEGVKKDSKVKRKKKKQEHKDKDIQLAIKQHGENNVKIIREG